MFGSKQPSVVRDCVAVRPPRLGLTPKQAWIFVLPSLSSRSRLSPTSKRSSKDPKQEALLAFHQPSRSISVTSPPYKRLSLAAPPNQGALSGPLLRLPMAWISGSGVTVPSDLGTGLGGGWALGAVVFFITTWAP